MSLALYMFMNHFFYYFTAFFSPPFLFLLASPFPRNTSDPVHMSSFVLRALMNYLLDVLSANPQKL